MLGGKLALDKLQTPLPFPTPDFTPTPEPETPSTLNTCTPGRREGGSEDGNNEEEETGCGGGDGEGNVKVGNVPLLASTPELTEKKDEMETPQTEERVVVAKQDLSGGDGEGGVKMPGVEYLRHCVLNAAGQGSQFLDEFLDQQW